MLNKPKQLFGSLPCHLLWSQGQQRKNYKRSGESDLSFHTESHSKCIGFQHLCSGLGRAGVHHKTRKWAGCGQKKKSPECIPFLKMALTTYHPFNLALTHEQKEKLKKPFTTKSPVSLKVTSGQIEHGDELLLTVTQINRLRKMKSLNKGVVLNLSRNQMVKLLNAAAAFYRHCLAWPAHSWNLRSKPWQPQVWVLVLRKLWRRSLEMVTGRKKSSFTISFRRWRQARRKPSLIFL